MPTSLTRKRACQAEYHAPVGPVFHPHAVPTMPFCSPCRTHQEEIIADAHSALATVLRSEISVFLLVQWCFAAYAVAALATIVSGAMGHECTPYGLN